MPEEPLQRILGTGVVGQPASIGPRQAEREKDDTPKERKRRRKRPASIEQTLEEEQELRVEHPDDDREHIDYHA